MRTVCLAPGKSHELGGRSTQRLRNAVQEMVDRANVAENQAQSYKDKLMEANGYVTCLEDAYQQLLKHNSDLQAKTVSDHTILLDLHSRMSSADEVLALLKQNLQKASNNIVEARSERRQLSEKYMQVLKSYRDLQDDFEENIMTIERLKSNLSEASEEEAALQKQIAALTEQTITTAREAETKQETLKQELQHALDDVTAKTKIHAELSQQLQQMKTDHDEEVKKLRDHAESVANANGQLLQHIDKLRIDNEEIKHELGRYTTHTAEQQHELENARKKLKDLEEETTELKSAITEKSILLKSHEKKSIELEGMLAEKENEHAKEIEKRLKQKENETLAKDEKIEALNQDLLTVRARLDDSLRETTQLREETDQELKKLSAQAEQLKLQLVENESHLRDTAKELDARKQELQIVEEEKEALHNVLRKSNQENEIQADALCKAKDDLKETQEEMNSHRDEISELRRRLHDLTKEMKDKDERIRKARAAFDIDSAPEHSSARNGRKQKKGQSSALRKHPTKRQKGQCLTVRFQEDYKDAGNQDFTNDNSVSNVVSILPSDSQEPNQKDRDKSLQSVFPVNPHVEGDSLLASQNAKGKDICRDVIAFSDTMSNPPVANQKFAVQNQTIDEDSASDKEAEESAPVSLRSHGLEAADVSGERMFSRRHAFSTRTIPVCSPNNRSDHPKEIESVDDEYGDSQIPGKFAAGMRLRKRKRKNERKGSAFQCTNMEQDSNFLFGGLFNRRQFSPDKAEALPQAANVCT